MPISDGAHLEEKCAKLGHPYQYYLGHDIEYWEVRHIWLDARVPEKLKISPTSMWSRGCMIIVLSHNTNPHRRGELIAYPVTVGDNTFIGMRAILFNCTIGEGAVIGAGAVVASKDIPPYTMAVGNPAKVIKRWDHEANEWVKVDDA